MLEVRERPALYYPYIHIRSEHWLKATLLCVPAVKRIVPDDYTPEDSPRILKYVRTEGPNGALLQAVPSGSPAAYKAQRRLLNKLRLHEDEITQRFRRGSGPKRDTYWVHVGKFTDEVLDYLRDKELAWPSEHSRPYGRRNWFALHPRLGSALMTTLGLSIARQNRYDIVTPSVRFHEALLATNEDATFDMLLAQHHSTRPTRTQAEHELSQLVISLSVNLEALLPEDIPELQASKHLAAFRSLIHKGASDVVGQNDPEEYGASLTTTADEIISTWNETRKELRRSIMLAVFGVAAKVLEETLKPAHNKLTVLASGPGMVVQLLSQGKSLMTNLKASAPYRYLTTVQGSERKLLRLTFPLGLER